MLVHAAIGERMQQHGAQVGRRHGHHVGAGAREREQSGWRRGRHGEHVARHLVSREEVVNAAHHRSAILAVRLEGVDLYRHGLRAGLGREQRLRRVEHEGRADAHPFRGESANGRHGVLHEGHAHDQVIREPREVAPIPDDVARGGRADHGVHRPVRESADLVEACEWITAGIGRVEQGRSRVDPVCQSRVAQRGDLGQVSGRNQQLHAGAR